MSEFMKIRKQYVTPNPYSRPQKSLKEIRAIVVHWVANPNTTDINNRDFFEGRKRGESGYGSAHEIIDLDGSIVIAIPEHEMAYHVGAEIYMKGIQEFLGHNYPNAVTYGIEVTHKNWRGELTKETWNALVKRLAQKCKEWGLNPKKDILRHYDVTGKRCPRYFVNNPSEFDRLKREVLKEMNKDKAFKDWQLNLGYRAIDSLAKDGIIKNPEIQKENLKNGKLEPWVTLTLLSRINEYHKEE